MEPKSLNEPRQGLSDNFELAGKVFEIERVRAMILGNAICKYGQIWMPLVNSLRLVQKSWLETITKTLQNANEPLFKLVLSKDNSVTANVGTKGKLLDQFIDDVASCSLSTGPSIPAFSVEMWDDFFEAENHGSLSKMLVSCGTGILELRIYFPVAVHSLKLIFPSFTLPRLRKLTIGQGMFKGMCDAPTGNGNDNVSHFVNSLLNGAPALGELVVNQCTRPDYDLPPFPFHLFTLPSSITILELNNYTTSDNLELLTKCRLPKLTSLTLSIPKDTSYSEGLLFRILDNFRMTLRKVTFGVFLAGNESPGFLTTFRFPVMESLQEFSNRCINCELEPGITSLETFLPKLTRLTLTQTTVTVRKWTQDSNWATLEQLTLNLASERVPDSHHEGDDLQILKDLHVAFPNLRSLNITVSAAHVGDLKYLFVGMTQLTGLRISVERTSVSDGLNCDFWDSLLIGAPVNFVTALTTAPDFWEQVQLMSGKLPSIRDLQELTSLSLRTSGPLRTPKKGCISDTSFHFAFLKMPKLKDLFMGYTFVVSLV